MDQQPQQTTTPPLTTTTTTTVPPPQTTVTTYPDSIDSSPRSRNTDSWNEDTNPYPTNNGSTAAPQAVAAAGSSKLRLMCSYGGHIVPRPHDKSLCYVGGDTRIVVVDRHTSLADLTHRLSKTLLRSSSSTSSVSSSLLLSSSQSVTTSFTLKYQLPSEDLDSLISVTTDEDLENMIDEYERLNMNNNNMNMNSMSSDVSKTSRLRLFLFPTKPESVSSIGSLLENSTKSEDWFLNALNGTTTSGFSDTSSVNCLLGLDDEVLVTEKKEAVVGKNLKGNGSGQDVHSVPDLERLERTSSFGSASSSPSLASLPPIRVHVDESQKVGGIEEQFSQMSVQQQQQQLQKVPVQVVQDDVAYVAAPAPVPVPVPVPVVVVSGVPASNTPVAAEYAIHQQKQAAGFDLASNDSVSSDGRQKPTMIYQDQLLNVQSANNSNRTSELNSSNVADQNTRIQMQQQQQQQQQQQISDSGYVMSMSNPQVDPQHAQMHHQQPQFIHAAVPQPQYIHHHPSGAVPLTSYYQMYPPQNQQVQHQHHPHHPPLDQQNFVYYMPARQAAPHGYNLQMQHHATGYAEVNSATGNPNSHSQAPPSAYTTARTVQTAPKSEIPSGVYGTANSGGSQFVQVPSGQHQPQPQYVGYSQVHHAPPPQSIASSASGVGPGANYGYEFADPATGQPIYYAAQPLPPQSGAQYQTVTAETGSYLPSDNSTKQQQGRTQQQP